jgi:hypothetical protein
MVDRYEPTTPVEISWTVEDRSKRKIKREHQKTTVTGTIIDVSVTGMYVDLPLEPRAEVGETVALASDGNYAVARVVRASHDEGRGRQLVGVEITDMSPEFTSDLNAVVAALRGDRGELTAWWERR